MNLTTISRIFDQNYNKTDLEASFRTPARNFITNNYDFLVEQGVSKMELNLSKQKVYRKDTLCTLCAVPFSNKTIYHRFRDSLMEDTKAVLDYIIWVEQLHQDDIESKLGFHVYTVTTQKLWNNYTRTQTTVKEQFKMFKSENAAGWYAQKPEYSLSLPTPFRRILAQYYDRPKGANFNSVKQPEVTNYVYNTGERDIQMELALLLAYSSQDNIKVTAKGRPSISTIGKLQRKLNINEFFPNEKDKPFKNLRSMLLAGMAVTLTQKQMNADIPVLLRDTVFKSNYLNRFESTPIVLHYLKGMNYVDYNELPSVEDEMFQVLRRLPMEEWVSFENIISYMNYNVIEVKPVLEHAAANKLYFQYVDRDAQYYTDKHYIRRGQYRRAILEPFIKGCFFFFASFGLVEIAYNKPDTSILGKTAFSPYDNLEYVRLTPLGYYVTGNTDTYVPPKGAGGSEMLLSEDSLTIIVAEEDEVVDTLLEPYATRISPSRFQTDYRIFLKECHSQKELNSKIKLFQQFISNDLPANWEAFFAELRQKIDPLKEVNNLRIFKIPTENSALIRLIARDTELKKLVVKAEGYHLLIEKQNMAEFKKRLQEFGYFMTV